MHEFCPLHLIPYPCDVSQKRHRGHSYTYISFSSIGAMKSLRIPCQKLTRPKALVRYAGEVRSLFLFLDLHRIFPIGASKNDVLQRVAFPAIGRHWSISTSPRRQCVLPKTLQDWLVRASASDTFGWLRSHSLLPFPSKRSLYQPTAASASIHPPAPCNPPAHSCPQTAPPPIPTLSANSSAPDH